MNLLPMVRRTAGAAIVRRLETEGVAFAAPLQGTLDGLASNREREAADRQRREMVAMVVFAYYVAKLDHPRAFYTPERERTLIALLATCGDDPNLLLYAIDGVQADDWAMGRHPRNPRKIEDFDWLFGTGVNRLEKYAETIPAYRAEKNHPLITKHSIPVGGSV